MNYDTMQIYKTKLVKHFKNVPIHQIVFFTINLPNNFLTVNSTSQ